MRLLRNVTSMNRKGARYLRKERKELIIKQIFFSTFAFSLSLLYKNISGSLRKLPTTSQLSIILPLPSVILNEVKNRIVTKGKPTAVILHFVQNDKYPIRHCELAKQS